MTESATVVLKRLSPGWAWVRENFKLPALLTILGCAGAAGIWIWSQHTDLQDLKKHDPAPALEKIDAKLSEVLETQAAMKQQLSDFGGRIAAQEAEWRSVHQAAAIRVPSQRRR